MNITRGTINIRKPDYQDNNVRKMTKMTTKNLILSFLRKKFSKGKGSRKSSVYVSFPTLSALSSSTLIYAAKTRLS